MIAVDTNLLVYAHREDYSQHARALAGLRELAGARHMRDLVRIRGMALLAEGPGHYDTLSLHTHHPLVG